MNKYIIYRIVNKLNGNHYVGQTTQGMGIRWKQHCRSRNNCVITRALCKYGKENFSICMLGSYENQKMADLAEQYFISFYNCLVPNGYNVAIGGFGRPSGWKHTAETIKIISASSKGNKNALGLRYKRLKRSEKHSKNLSKANKGKLVNNKAVYCLETLIVYESTKQAAKVLNLDQSKISLVALNKRNHTGGYRFRYVN